MNKSADSLLQSAKQPNKERGYPNNFFAHLISKRFHKETLVYWWFCLSVHSKEVFLGIRTRIYPSIVLRRTRAAARVGGSEEGGGCCTSSSTFSKVCDGLKAAAWDFGLVGRSCRRQAGQKGPEHWACARRLLHIVPQHKTTTLRFSALIYWKVLWKFSLKRWIPVITSASQNEECTF